MVAKASLEADVSRSSSSYPNAWVRCGVTRSVMLTTFRTSSYSYVRPTSDPAVPVATIGGAISTPIIVDDHLIACGYDAKVHVFRIRYDDPKGVRLKARDGHEVRVGLKEMATFKAGAIESTPVVWRGRIYIGSRDGFLYCLGEK